MNPFVFLTIAVLIIAVVALLLGRASDRGGGSAKFSLAKVFEVDIQIGASERRTAEENVAAAEKARGQPRGAGVEVPAEVLLTRVLWVDDHPDNNVYETIALENLGFLVTVATSTEAAMKVLPRLRFGVAITDMRRGENPTAGAEFANQARALQPSLPIIAYTADAARVTRPANIQAVVDKPAELISAVAAATQARAGS